MGGRSSRRYDLLRPDPAGTIQSLASLGYTPEAAVADLVDNSIAASASRVDITFRWEGESGSWVSLCDNGQGMSEAELLRGMTVGGRGRDARGEHDLGRFGMGLKSASFSQARQLIVSTRRGSGAWHTRTWDIGHVLDAGDWELLRGCPEGSRELLATHQRAYTGSGTIVLWRQLTRLVAPGAAATDEWAQKEFYRHANRVESHLAMVFARYLARRGGITLTLDGQKIKPWDPFLSRHSFVEQLSAESPLPGVRVQGYVLPHRSRLGEEEYLAAAGPRGWLEQQGFYVYRRDRLIVAGDWLNLGDFRKDEKHVLARIAVELPPDQDFDWGLDVKKSSAMPPAALVTHLRRVGKATRARASAVMSHRGRVIRDRQTSSPDFVWRVVKQFGRTKFVVNREHALVKDLLDRNPGVRTDLWNLLNMVEAALPVGVIQTTTDVGERVRDDVEEPPDDVVEMARRMLEVLLRRGDRPAVAIDRIGRMPPFNDYPVIASLLTGRHEETDVRQAR